MVLAICALAACGGTHRAATPSTTSSSLPNTLPPASSIDPPNDTSLEATQSTDSIPTTHATTDSDGDASARAPGALPTAAPRSPSRNRTPLQQGTSASELGITATIKRAISTDATLGANAKGIEVVTSGTKVTLRGQADTAAEKALLVSYARQSAEVTDVDIQIDLPK